MQRTEPQEIFLRDYKAPAFLIDKVDLQFELDDKATRVTSRLSVHVNPEAKYIPHYLTLDGKDLTLESVAFDGRKLEPNEFEVRENALIINNVTDRFTLEIKTLINPEANTELSGLYKSKGNFCTQCEAEGFRRITYFLDRPDVMATYTTTIIADEKQHPVLLSNGNFVEKGKLEGGKHWIKWEDPFKKPSYLYALVAGNFDYIEDKYHTKEKESRTISLQIYAEKGYIDRCVDAMEALKKAMRWDEDEYGRVCDLDVYKIVAVSDFNAGAMENKGLNIFNAKYILSSPQTTTDQDYLDVEATIGHEYFHNWTGNRITCRDWFQLSLKEGLTTFREHSFVEDISSVAARISDVGVLRNRQFMEDAGPLAHPVQPQSYIEIDNFYTTTVYRKGAEIYRMLQTTLGKEGFRKGMDLYFERHDGQAVTIEQFVKAMEDASNCDLSQFLLWFHQAGTPVLDVQDEYNEEKQTYTLKITQSCPATPGQPNKKPMAIPVKMGLLDEKGAPVPLYIDGSLSAKMEAVLLVTNPVHEFHFANVTTRPAPSLLRGFSAPVKLNYPYTEASLKLLTTHDSDLFNRWDASRRYFTNYLLKLITDYQFNTKLEITRELLETFNDLLQSKIDDLEIFSMMISLPTESELANKMKIVDVDAIYFVRKVVSREIAKEFGDKFLKIYQYCLSEEKSISAKFDEKESGKRSLKNMALAYLSLLNTPESRKLATEQFDKSLSVNMTDTIAAFSSLMGEDSIERTHVIDQFYKKWKDDSHVMDYWFEEQALSRLPGTLENVKKLMQHEAFDIKNPNKVFSLIGPFCRNFTQFHAATGEGYAFIADVVLQLDPMNAKCASDAVMPLTKWQRYDESRQILMCKQLQRILDHKDLSRNVYEIVKKGLGEVQKKEEKISKPFSRKKALSVMKSISGGIEVKAEPKKHSKRTSYFYPILGGVTLAAAGTLAGFGLYRFFKRTEPVLDQNIGAELTKQLIKPKSS